jgi:hypothetical protein
MPLDNELRHYATRVLAGWEMARAPQASYDQSKRFHVIYGSRILGRAIQTFERIAESLDPLQEDHAITTLRALFLSFHAGAKRAREHYRVCEYARR